MTNRTHGVTMHGRSPVEKGIFIAQIKGPEAAEDSPMTQATSERNSMKREKTASYTSCSRMEFMVGVVEKKK